MDVILERAADFVAKGFLDEVLTVGNHADGPYLLVKMQQQGKNIDQQKQLLVSNGGNRIGEKISSVGWDGSVYADQFWRSYPLGNARDHHPDLIVLDLEWTAAEPETPAPFAVQSRMDRAPLVLLGSVRRPTSPPATGGEFVAKPYHYGPLIRKIEELLDPGLGEPHRAVAVRDSRERPGQRASSWRKPIVRLGRDSSSPVQLHDTEVSRHHAELRRTRPRLHRLRPEQLQRHVRQRPAGPPAPAGQRRPGPGRQHADALHRPAEEPDEDLGRIGRHRRRARRPTTSRGSSTRSRSRRGAALRAARPTCRRTPGWPGRGATCR